MTPLISICIPSYNRPIHLLRLLESIDVTDNTLIEVVICEDLSPKRDQIKEVVNVFRGSSIYNINLYLNEFNLGYDANLKELISKATGNYIMFMGDDDIFQPEALNEYISFLSKNNQLGYILRRYSIVHRDGITEEFRYFNTDIFYKPGLESLISLFRKSVFISGFCFKKEFVIDFYDTDDFNGTLLYQLFLCGELVLNYPSAYCNIPLTIMDENERGIPEFGTSSNESSKYTPGKISIDNSINFMKSFFVITKYFDIKYNVELSSSFNKDLSKYSYPVLSIQRDTGIQNFIKYNKTLKKEININSTIYYYIYYYALIFFGRNICDLLIVYLKRIIGKTPTL